MEIYRLMYVLGILHAKCDGLLSVVVKHAFVYSVQ